MTDRGIATIVDHDTKDRVAKDRELAKSLGLITVEVRRTIEKSPLHKGSASQFGNPVLELTKKALKGKEISHGTVYAPPTPHPIAHFLRPSLLLQRHNIYGTNRYLDIGFPPATLSGNRYLPIT